MSGLFKWNPYADQPHNIAPKKERLWNHFRYSGSYISLIWFNLSKAIPVLTRYRHIRKTLYRKPVHIEDPFGVSVSPGKNNLEKIISGLEDLNIRKTLIRIPSWEKNRLSMYREFIKDIHHGKREVMIALLQNREDVKNPKSWKKFLEQVFDGFRDMCQIFEIGHAWNRTKWGVWDYKEYLELARPALECAKKYKVKIAGPAVIDFEFHLYPAVLRYIPFDFISSLLYVDRVGAPENTQFGWDTAKKTALLRAVVDEIYQEKHSLWVTEVNWPLAGTGKYSPASGKPNVSESLQRDYLTRYYILVLAGGLIDRVYWWQLAAPGYGLIDNRDKSWRQRPAFSALRFLVSQLRNSDCLGRIQNKRAEIFSFRRNNEDFVICWTDQSPHEHKFTQEIKKIKNVTGEEINQSGDTIQIDGSPKYVYFT
jgi:hypothetical protein